MKQQSFEGQFDDEVVQFVFRRHPIVLRKALLVLLVLLTVSMLPYTFFPSNFGLLYLILVGLVIGLIIFMYSWMGWFFSLFIVSDQRLIQITQKGFFRRNLVELSLDKIQNVNYEIDGLQASLLHYGRIVIQTFVGDLILEPIHHPVEIHRKLSHSIRGRDSRSLEEEEDADEA
jgi:uncharacterized membrane protein YdbT with pleckstrin-like domain